MDDLHKVEKGVQSVRELLSKIMSARRSGSSSKDLRDMVAQTSGLILEMRHDNRTMCQEIEKKERGLR